jgi:hypothetical protein
MRQWSQKAVEGVHEMRLRSALACALLVFVSTMGSVSAAVPASHQSSAKPSIKIMSATVSGSCIVVNVGVHNFKLVKPVFHKPPLLKGNRGHLLYLLNSPKSFNAYRDSTTRLTNKWCGSKDGVKRGHNKVYVFLVNSRSAVFPGTKPATRTLMVK